MSRIFMDIRRQIRYRGYKLRGMVIYFLVVNLVLAILPVSVCRYLDRNFMSLVMIVNLTYALSVLYFFLTGITYVDGQGSPACQEPPLFAELNPRYCLSIRLFTNLVFTMLCFGNAMLGSSLMNKFADENHSYLKFGMKGNIPAGFLLFAIVFPLLYHLVRLISRRGKEKSFSLPALILIFFIMELYGDVSARLPDWQAALMAAVMIVVVFLKAEDLEKKRH